MVRHPIIKNITVAENIQEELEQKKLRQDEDELNNDQFIVPDTDEENENENKSIKKEEEEEAKEKLNKLYIKETTCVCINEQWVEITSLKLNQLKEQLKLRNIKCEGNKDKLVITLKEVYI